ncbi:beta-1,3-glucanase family protein [Couchioplanes caeruleus]|uniref:Uncharacterized protein n=2 Tax=Couchioplanes caeruleus TaxID=56438 RepID=A0A1K0GND8_9ACTN|nr:beta-1,3-glucanase family protein [Couchioplanes caeruleus]OJF10715.1 hypothetical protein BG844_30560 [Couchioplanes caeruleus subsp. caeruleus]ROP28182.1 carbohydrate binding protein with CBM6 domain [Couchioplanes caeruleus]
MTITRRTLLGLTAGAVAAGVPLVGALTTRAFAADGLPLTIANDTGRFPNSAITVYVVGTDPAGRQGFVSRSRGFTPCSTAQNGPDGFADLGIPLTGGTTTLILPKMSGRVYVAIGDRLRFKVVTDGAGRPALQFPAGWVAGDPSFGVLHDCIEFTYNDAGMFCNTTMVDMFSIPMSIKLDGERSQRTGLLTPGGRDRIFAAVAAQPDFGRLVVGDRLRVIAPGHGIDGGRFPASYFAGYVDHVWRTYAQRPLTVTTNAGTFTGRVLGDRLVFNRGAASFGRPSSRDLLFCDGTLAAPNDGVTGPVAAVLGAALNRSTLHDRAQQPVAEAAAHYRNPVTNHYSRVMHENSVDRRAYGFAFDDVNDHASYLEDHAPKGMRITLTPFGAAPAVGTAAAATTPAAGGSVRDAYGRTEAERHDAQSGTATQGCAEGGRNVGWIGAGDWLRYDRVDFGKGPARKFAVRAASGAAAGVSGLVEVRLGGPTAPVVGSLSVATTGGWQSWRTVYGTLTAPVTGVHDVYLTFASGQRADFVNVNWLTFAR